MLKTIERITRQRISIEKVPTVADLRARRLELTRASLHDALLGDDLDHYRVVVETLTDEFDVMEVALAAVKLAHEAASGPITDEDDIPAMPKNADGARRRDARERGPSQHRSSGNTVRLFVGVGRRSGVRPQDLVGAIAGESSLRGRDIGAIEISDRFSLVEVPNESATEVIAALQAATIKGKRATVRLERDMPPGQQDDRPVGRRPRGPARAGFR